MTAVEIVVACACMALEGLPGRCIRGKQAGCHCCTHDDGCGDCGGLRMHGNIKQCGPVATCRPWKDCQIDASEANMLAATVAPMMAAVEMAL
eukprot:1159971-Pelagomonas_calceolata.AAC.4